MADRPDREAHDRATLAENEAKRIAFAAARVAEHADRELTLLTRATEAASDYRARQLEGEADAAYRDFIALIEEHGLAR
jgi:hypothetical protein